MLRRSARLVVTAFALTAGTACVPADEALPLGSVEFTLIGPRTSTQTIPREEVDDDWEITVDRFILSFKTMTIVNDLDNEQCSYRGKGLDANVVFDAAGEGYLVQSFNGFKPGDCPDVGLRLGAPDDRTTLGTGVTPVDLIALAVGSEAPAVFAPPAHAILEATAKRARRDRDGTEGEEVIRLSLRFDTARTGASFGGCRDAVRGARIRPAARYPVTVSWSARPFFRVAFAAGARLRFDPFAYADQVGDGDGVVTMKELDDITSFYPLPSGTGRATFGEYVREQFRSTVSYGRGGQCNGLEAGFKEE